VNHLHRPRWISVIGFMSRPGPARPVPRKIPAVKAGWVESKFERWERERNYFSSYLESNPEFSAIRPVGKLLLRHMPLYHVFGLNFHVLCFTYCSFVLTAFYNVLCSYAYLPNRKYVDIKMHATIWDLTRFTKSLGSQEMLSPM
jgi:hypothetical protein